MSKSGISEGNRAHIEALSRNMKGPFGIHDADGILKMGSIRTKRFLAYLANRGWLARVRHGAYITVPLEASDPASWREDPWIVAHTLFAPAYISGWSAAEHWGFTEQVFRDIVVITSKTSRRTRVVIQGTNFRLKVLDSKHIFGTRPVWRKQIKVAVADPSRMLIDILDDPSLGGGVAHIAGVLRSYFESEHRDDSRLLDYAARRGNRTVFKRLGYLVEASAIDASDLLAGCRKGMSTNLSVLDPAVKARGRIVTAWKLRVNVTLPRVDAE